MKKLNHVKVRSFFKRKPKVIIPVVAILCILFFTVLEYVRATIYLSSVEDYKKSVLVQNIKDSVAKLQFTIGLESPSYFCDIELSKLKADNSVNGLDYLMSQINKQVKLVQASPAFSSLLEFLPKPKEARVESVDLRKAVDDIAELVKKDVRTDYCLELDSILSDISFLQDLQKPEGVSALLVGQIENYQIGVSQAKDKLLTLKFPSDFEQNHIEIIEIINKIQADLRGNDNNYKQFSRAIETDIAAINEALSDIRTKVTDLQKIPEQIDIAASTLE